MSDDSKKSVADYRLISDLVENILKFSDNPEDCANYITTQIRELIGVRIVAIVECIIDESETSNRLIGICPSRKKSFWNQPQIQDFVTRACTFETPRLIDPISDPEEESLASIEIGTSFVIPLLVGSERVGMIILLDLMEPKGASIILESVNKISGVIALVLRNSLFYKKMENTVEIQTRELKERDNQFRMLFEQAAVGVAQINTLSGKFLNINKKYCDIVGYSEDEMFNMDFQSITYPDDLKISFDNMELLRSKKIHEFNMEKRYVRKNGEVIWVEATVSSMWNSDESSDYHMTIIRDITSRKQTEKILREKQQFIESLINLSPDIIYIYDIIEQKNVYTNDGILKMLDYSVMEVQEMGGQLLSILMHPEDFKIYLEETYPKYSKIKDDEPVIHQHRMKHKNGEWYWLDCSEIIYLREPDGAPRQIFGVAHDITERKRAEIALKKSEMTLLKAQEIAHIGSWEWDVKANKITWSAELYRIYDIDPEIELTYDVMMERIHPDDRDWYNENTAKWVENGNGVPYEYRIVRHDGSIRYIFAKCEVKSDENGKTVTLFGTAHDITERKQTETIIKQQNKYLASLLKISQLIVTTVDMDTLLQNIVDSATNLIGLDTGAIYLLKGDDLYLRAATPPILPEFPDVFRRTTLVEHPHIQKAIITGTPVILPDMLTAELSPAEEEIRDSSGIRSLLYVPLLIEKQSIGVLILGTQKETRSFSDAEIKLYVTLSSQIALAIENALLYQEKSEHTEILEQRVVERTYEIEGSRQALVSLVEDLGAISDDLTNANERLQELDLMKSIFIASTSHELRTPLNSIIGFTSVLLEGWSGDLNSEQKEQLGIVLTSGKYLLNLINDVIDISKIEAGKIEIYTEQFNLGDVVNEAVSLIKTDVEQKGLTITVDVPDITINTDRRRLLQCIINLLSNAMKFTEKGSITIEAKTINNVVDISISDTGIGIKEEDLTKLFKAFVRLESSLTDATPGTGLGLYLTDKLAQEVLGGTIDATSKHGVGSTFTLHIPVTYGVQK